MDWTLEVVVVPVSDLDKAKEFYAERMGFGVDFDVTPGPGNRIVQLTPPGSGCSIVIGTAVGTMEPGTLSGVQLVVRDVRAAREELLGRGVEVGEVQVAGPDGFRPATEDDDLNNQGFLFLQDPDGNRWTVQQITDRR
ncbi:VOC family protein [Actinophytocola xanthii]|uniref:Glyoxalase n=1 Tax=Actinophytocola xanthii TaxID=1912961 RepID=A0A1Q8CC48_9PSEU|nr:VOC family protein [Actinophytocola xanthii]OLF11944.1 glyoxalase [Actinophytocola xanthii]